MDFIAESRKEKLMRKLLIPCLVQKNLLYFANYKKPTQERRNRRESFWERFSSFLIIGDHKKIWSRAKTIFGAPSLPPPFPPFPPQSSVFQIDRRTDKFQHPLLPKFFFFSTERAGPYPQAKLYWTGRTMGWMADWTRYHKYARVGVKVE